MAAIEPGLRAAASAIAKPRLAHERHRLLERHRLGRRESRELPDGMADDEVGLHATLSQGREHRQRGRDERRLLHRGIEQLLSVGVEAEALEVEARRRAATLEHRPGGRNGLGEVPTHAGLERALAREAEGDLAHAATPPAAAAGGRVSWLGVAGSAGGASSR